MPDVLSLTLSEAVRKLKSEGFQYMVVGNGKNIVTQMPKPGAQMQEGSIIAVYTDEEAKIDQDAFIAVPDVTGLSVMQANRVLTSYGLKMTVEGTGIAAFQNPGAGENVFPTAEVAVTFRLPGNE